jgi:hypothetical protein
MVGKNWFGMRNEMGEHGHFMDTLHQNAAMASLAISVSSLLTLLTQLEHFCGVARHTK